MIGSVQYMTGPSDRVSAVYMTGPNDRVSDVYDLRIVGNLPGGVWVGMILELLKMLLIFMFINYRKTPWLCFNITQMKSLFAS